MSNTEMWLFITFCCAIISLVVFPPFTLVCVLFFLAFALRGGEKAERIITQTPNPQTGQPESSTGCLLTYLLAFFLVALACAAAVQILVGG